MLDTILDQLRQAKDPAQKAAIIANRAIVSLPNDVASIARSCVIFHWFNEKIIEAIIPHDINLSSADIYKRICSFPFVEMTALGATYHDLTRQGLIDFYSSTYKHLFQDVSKKAGEAYLALGKDKKYLAEAFYCFSISGSPKAAELWQQLLGKDASNISPQFYKDVVWLQNEAERFPFVVPLYLPISFEQETANTEWLLKHPYVMPPNFTGRISERQMLTNWLQGDNQNRLFIIRALGGFGKSSLSWYWLTHDINFKQWPLVIWWSFYEVDSNFEHFVEESLKYLKLEVPHGQRNQVDKLLKTMQSQKILLIMDGFERSLRAYNNMNATYQGIDETVLEDSQLDCVNINAEIFLKSVCSLPNINSKVLMTTRLTPRAVKPHSEFLFGCREEELTGMEKEDAVQFFYSQKIKGTQVEIQEACAIYGFHPLSLRLLSGIIRTDPNSPLDISVAKRTDVSDDILQRKHHVLKQAYDSLSIEGQKLLSMIACFRSRVEYKTIETITEDKYSLDKHLQSIIERGLVHWDRKTNKYDMHPIVRRFAYDRLIPADRTEVHKRLVNYFEGIPTPQKPEKLEDLAPIIELYHHMVMAGKSDDAIKLFSNRLTDTLYFQLGAYQIIVELLLTLFQDSEDKPPTLKEESDQTWTLNTLANAYALSGQPRKALRAFKMVLSIDEENNDKSSNAAITLGNMANLAQLPTGAIRDAEYNLRRYIELSIELGIESINADAYQELGRVISYCGRWDEADKILSKGLDLATSNNHEQIQYNILLHYSLYYILMSRTNLKFKIENLKQAILSASRALELGDEYSHRNFRVERDYIRAYWLLGASYRTNSDLAKAEDNLSKAISICRQINLVETEANILLDLARLRYDQKKYEEAKSLAEEALLITERCGYVLQGADVNLFIAQYALEQEQDKAKAKQYAEEAKKLATCDGPPYYYKVAYEEAERFLEMMKAEG